MRLLRRLGQMAILGAGAYGLWRLVVRPSPHVRSDRRRIERPRRSGGKDCDDPVDRASCDSFPASDPPAYNAGDRMGPPPRP
jgi:hypothetical protein